MKLCIVTIVLDGSPWIQKHLDTFKELVWCPWQWIVVHGASMNNGSTKWCQPQHPRLSLDGTTEYLRSIRKEPSVLLLEHTQWHSKDQMINAAVMNIAEPCVIMEIDADEMWTSGQLEKIVQLFEDLPDLTSIMFPCRYFVGRDLVLEGNNCYGDYDYEWLRAWRFVPGMRFKSHEPPILTGDCGKRLNKSETRKLGLVFDHMAYATESQVKYKEVFYGYKGLLNQWRTLQRWNDFPVHLSQFFSHVPRNDGAMVNKTEIVMSSVGLRDKLREGVNPIGLG